METEMDIYEAKKALRREITSLKKAFPAEAKSAGAMAIFATIEAIPEFKTASTVLIYHALPDEVPTAPFLNRWYGRKKLVLPLVAGDTLVLKQYDPAQVRPGYRDIPEPLPICITIPPADVDLAIIPGVAFDAACHRLGRGRGFYDRLLPQLSCPLVGICFDFQLVPSIPCEPFDFPLSAVISPTQTQRRC